MGYNLAHMHLEGNADVAVEGSFLHLFRQFLFDKMLAIMPCDELILQ